MGCKTIFNFFSKILLITIILVIVYFLYNLFNLFNMQPQASKESRKVQQMFKFALVLIYWDLSFLRLLACFVMRFPLLCCMWEHTCCVVIAVLIILFLKLKLLNCHLKESTELAPEICSIWKLDELQWLKNHTWLPHAWEGTTSAHPETFISTTVGLCCIDSVPHLLTFFFSSVVLFGC